jgi:hypothetical protein
MNRRDLLAKIEALGRQEYRRRIALNIPLNARHGGCIDPTSTATPAEIARLHSAFDALAKTATPLHQCSDGCYRNEKQIKVWLRDGEDELSRLRKQLRQKHCGCGGSSTRPGHICSCITR